MTDMIPALPLRALHRLGLATGALLVLWGPPAPAQEAALPPALPAVGPALGVSTNLAQGAQAGLLRVIRGIGVTDVRDGMNWSLVEKTPGTYDFSQKRTAFPDDMLAAGLTVSLVVNWGNPLHDGGDTPHSPEALAALGAYAAALVTRFPDLASLEIGNEFNGTNFVRGPLARMTPQDRARAYVPFLAAAAEGARAVRPEVRISGGSTHSMAAGYLWEVLDAGADGILDTLAIHPYTTPAEQLVRQVAVLRRHPAAARLPIEVTEFGAPNPARAPSHLVRNYCQMALSGVSRAVWFPLNDRGDGMEPLFIQDGRITPAGRAYRLVAARMEGRPVQDAATDPFTFGCRFGTDTLVLWGAARPLDVAEGTDVFDAEGRPVSAPFALSPEDPLILVTAEGGDIAGAVQPGAAGLIADSFYQFAYPEGEEAQAEGDGFARFARRDGREIPLVTRPGQEAPGTPWFPYRGIPGQQAVRLTAEVLLPGGTANRPIDIVHRYTAPAGQTLDLAARFAVSKRSEDGVAVQVTLNGTELVAATATGDTPAEIAQPGLTLARGDVLEIAVSPGATTRGDITDYRITLRAPS